MPDISGMGIFLLAGITCGRRCPWPGAAKARPISWHRWSIR